MAMRSGQELRDSALEFREMAATGSDVRLREALLLIAEEFEQEAALQEGHADEADSPISITRYPKLKAAAHPAPTVVASTDTPENASR
jgi:hypothetical protein